MKLEVSELTNKLVPVIDPLKAKEEQAAINAAKAHVAKDLSGHYRILGAELRIERPPDGGKVERMLGVRILDYGNKRSFEVLVNATCKVVRIVEFGSGQPAHMREEVKEVRAELG